MTKALLDLSHIESGYEKKQVLFDISMSIQPGEIVSLIGHNGAGKTTLLRTIFGHITPAKGNVNFSGKDINTWSTAQRVQEKLVYIPQEQFVFRELSVEENLVLAAYTLLNESEFKQRLAECYQFLPILEERRHQKAGTLSGGQQRILSLGMIMVLCPRLLLLDEPSLGLAPSLVDQAMDLMREMASRFEMTVLLVEQNIKKAFQVADRVYVMRGGRLIAERPGGELSSHDELWDLF